MSTHTFGVTSADPFGIATASFALMGITPVISLDPVIADDARGEFVAASQKSVNAVNRIGTTYKSQVLTAIASITATAGAADPTALESVTVTTTKGVHATGSASGHLHVGGTNSDHNASSRTVTIPEFAGFGASAFGLSIGVPEASLQSSSYTIEIGHTDDQDNGGNFLCGTSHGEKHTATFEAVDETDWTIPSGWIASENMPDGESIEANNAHMRRRFTIVKHVGFTYS